MIPGLSKIVKCPYCGKKKELMTLISGNCLYEHKWSDGKVIYPMLPSVSAVQKCPKCGKYYLQNLVESEVGKKTTFKRGLLSYKEWKEAYIQFCSECPKISKSSIGSLSYKKKIRKKYRLILNRNDWNYIRLRLIQAYNDDYYRFNSSGNIRRRISTPPQKEFDFIVGIINDFIKASKGNTVDDKLLIADLYRESKQFDKCEETLLSISYYSLDRPEQWIYNNIKTRKDKGDVVVIKIPTWKQLEIILEKEEKERKKRAEKEWVKKESKDPRYKCCENGHCYKNTEHFCRWCGKDYIVKRLDVATPIKTIDLYVGIRNRRWVLTKDPDIEGKHARIRKITVEMVGKYKLYYHLDGQNPNPFPTNKIVLGDGQIIGGATLLHLCDMLVESDLKEVFI